MLVVGGRESWRRTEESASARSVEPEGPRVTSTPHDPLHILLPSLIFCAHSCPASACEFPFSRVSTDRSTDVARFTDPVRRSLLLFNP